MGVSYLKIILSTCNELNFDFTWVKSLYRQILGSKKFTIWDIEEI